MQELLLHLLRVGYELLLVWLVWTAWIGWDGREQLLAGTHQQGQPRQRHPQNPRDCPVCRAAHGVCEVHTHRVVEPWTKQKSKRGRPKVIDTDGYWCPNPQCRYFKITDAQVHALVGMDYIMARILSSICGVRPVTQNSAYASGRRCMT